MNININPILVGLFVSNIGRGAGFHPTPLVSQEIMQEQGYISHLYRPIFIARSNGKGFESLRRHTEDSMIHVCELVMTYYHLLSQI